jgi:prolipoprotein diacylglyceryltransferase
MPPYKCHALLSFMWWCYSFLEHNSKQSIWKLLSQFSWNVVNTFLHYFRQRFKRLKLICSMSQLYLILDSLLRYKIEQCRKNLMFWLVNLELITKLIYTLANAFILVRCLYETFDIIRNSEVKFRHCFASVFAWSICAM